MPVETPESITDATRMTSDIPMLTALRRGIARRCPACGEGPVLAGYLRRLPSCNVCGEDLSHIRADDGPAWATLIVVGHLLAPLMIMLGRDESIPSGSHSCCYRRRCWLVFGYACHGPKGCSSP